MKGIVTLIAVAVASGLAGGYVGWKLKPPGAESLALSALQSLADRRAAESRAKYEALAAELSERQAIADVAAMSASEALRDAEAFARDRESILKAEIDSATAQAMEAANSEAAARSELDLASRAMDSALEKATPEVVVAVEAETAAFEGLLAVVSSERNALRIVVQDQSEQLSLKESVEGALRLNLSAEINRSSVFEERLAAANDRIDELNDAGLRWGPSVLAGGVKPFRGSWAPGMAVGFAVSYTW